MDTLSTSPLVKHDLQRAVVSLTTWYKERVGEDLGERKEIKRLLERRGHPETRLVLLSLLLEKLVKSEGIHHIDLWWQAEGKRLCWDETQQRPLPVIAHLLSHASAFSNFTLGVWALDQGWPPEAVVSWSSLGETPLHHFMMVSLPSTPEDTQGYYSLCERLLTPKTVNACTTCGRTALTLLVGRDVGWGGNNTKHLFVLDLCKKLVNAGADIHVADNEKWTALHYAVAGSKRPNLELITWLLKQGADPTLSTIQGDTPLSLCEGAGTHWPARVTQTLKELLVHAVRQHDAKVLQTNLAEGNRSSLQRRRL